MCKGHGSDWRGRRGILSTSGKDSESKNKDRSAHRTILAPKWRVQQAFTRVSGDSAIVMKPSQAAQVLDNSGRLTQIARK
jgi:hypothetical protein